MDPLEWRCEISSQDSSGQFPGVAAREVIPSMFGRGILWRCSLVGPSRQPVLGLTEATTKDKSVKLISGVGLLESVQLQEVRSQACHEGGCCYWSNVIFYMDQRDQERGIGSDGVVHTMDLIAVLNHWFCAMIRNGPPAIGARVHRSGDGVDRPVRILCGEEPHC